MLLAVAPGAQAQSASRDDAVRYTVSFAAHDQHRLHVVMKLAPSADLQLQLPAWYGLYQIRDFSRYLLDLAARDASERAIVVRQLDKDSWSAPGAADVDYDITAELP